MPICSSQGQISSGRAWMVTARVALNVGCLTTSSPDMARATSSSVAPHRSCQGRMKLRYAPAATPRAANDMAIFLNIKVPPLGRRASLAVILGDFDCQKLLSPLYRVVPGRHGGVTSACFPLTKPSQFHPGSEPPRTLGKAALWTEVDEPTSPCLQVARARSLSPGWQRYPA